MMSVKRLFVLLILLTPILAHAANPNETLLGKWHGIDSAGVKGGFTFNADGSAEMISGSDVYNQSADYKLIWETEVDREPVRVLLIMVSKQDNSTIAKFHMILEIVSKDKIRLGIVDNPKSNPASIDSLKESDRITMTRK